MPFQNTTTSLGRSGASFQNLLQVQNVATFSIDILHPNGSDISQPNGNDISQSFGSDFSQVSFGPFKNDFIISFGSDLGYDLILS